MSEESDLIVLGGGMAGLPVAMKCAYSGMDTALVEQDLLGGTCLNRGCIPTKTMIRSAEVANLARRSEEFGIKVNGDVSANMEVIVDRKNAVVESIREGSYENVANNDNLTLIEEHGAFESANELRVGDRTITADRIVINTGARPAKPPVEGLDDVETLDSTDMLFLDFVPDALVVVGGGYVGCEYAQMYSRFGANVTVIQRPDRLLPREEPDISAVIEDVFVEEGIDVRTETSVTAFESAGDEISVEADGPDGTVEVSASDVLLTAGRNPNTDEIGLEAADVETTEQGFVETDDSFATTANGVYAIGDVSGPPMFTHSARDDADLLYRHLAKDEAVSTEGRVVPWAVFTDPQVGHVGLTEQEARDEGYEVGVGRQDLTEQAKPKALGETDGFVKLVTDVETDELLGAHIVGNRAQRSSTSSFSRSNSARQRRTSRTPCISTRPFPKASIRRREAFTSHRNRGQFSRLSDLCRQRSFLSNRGTSCSVHVPV